MHLKKTFVDPERYKIAIIKRNETSQRQSLQYHSLSLQSLQSQYYLWFLLAILDMCCTSKLDSSKRDAQTQFSLKHSSASKLLRSQCCVSFSRSFSLFYNNPSILSLFSVVECSINRLFIVGFFVPRYSFPIWWFGIFFFQIVNKKSGLSGRWLFFRAITVHECIYFVQWACNISVAKISYNFEYRWNFENLNTTRDTHTELNISWRWRAIRFTVFQLLILCTCSIYVHFIRFIGHENLFAACVWSALLFVFGKTEVFIQTKNLKKIRWL